MKTATTCRRPLPQPRLWARPRAVLARRVQSEKGKATVANLNARIYAWWVMAAVFGGVLLLGPVFTTILFAALSFLAMREFITLNRTERADHEVLFWAFFVILPLHYFIVGIRWYGMFTIFIPVYAFALPAGLFDSTPNSSYRMGRVEPAWPVPSNATASVWISRS